MIKQSNSRNMMSGLLATIILIASSCNLVSDSHEINTDWILVNYETPDSTINFANEITITFKDSEKVNGAGPIQSYRGDVEIWKDGSIQFGNLCCGDTAHNSSLALQAVFYNGLGGSSEYEITGNQLTLRGAGTVIQFQTQ